MMWLTEQDGQAAFEGDGRWEVANHLNRYNSNKRRRSEDDPL